MIENEKRPREGLEQQRSAEKGLNEKGLKAEKPKKVLVELKELDPGFWGYDVQILDEASTVQDYLEELNRFQKERVAPCGGCTNCCWERVPLTASDVRTYLLGLEKAAAGLAEENAAATIAGFLERFGRVRSRRGVVDITLRREENGACCFLDQENHCCRHWPLRSLVCQTYVCLPASRRAAALRRQIVNEGENVLIRLYAEEAGAAGKMPAVEGDGGNIPWTEYRGKGFDAANDAGTGSVKAGSASPENFGANDAGAGSIGINAVAATIRNYDQVLLRDVVSAGLWQLLTEK